ncbi:hypothetical protein [Xanthovirga aplysinae]|nr:hypothetical protein [Xanthovirga aplysinae]
MTKQLEELWAYTEKIAKEELNEKPSDFTLLEGDKVEQTID